MENNDWDTIISEEVENMICRLRDRGVEADNFIVNVTGQKRIEKPLEEDSINDDDFEEMLEKMKQNLKNRKKEKYIECYLCGDRVPESKISANKLCPNCMKKTNSKKESFYEDLKRLINNSTDFSDFMKKIEEEKKKDEGDN